MIAIWLTYLLKHFDQKKHKNQVLSNYSNLSRIYIYCVISKGANTTRELITEISNIPYFKNFVFFKDILNTKIQLIP